MCCPAGTSPAFKIGQCCKPDGTCAPPPPPSNTTTGTGVPSSGSPGSPGSNCTGNNPVYCPPVNVALCKLGQKLANGGCCPPNSTPTSGGCLATGGSCGAGIPSMCCPAGTAANFTTSPPSCQKLASTTPMGLPASAPGPTPPPPPAGVPVPVVAPGCAPGYFLSGSTCLLAPGGITVLTGVPVLGRGGTPGAKGVPLPSTGGGASGLVGVPVMSAGPTNTNAGTCPGGLVRTWRGCDPRSTTIPAGSNAATNPATNSGSTLVKSAAPTGTKTGCKYRCKNGSNTNTKSNALPKLKRKNNTKSNPPPKHELRRHAGSGSTAGKPSGFGGGRGFGGFGGGLFRRR
jgi:hypothetical protein